MKAAVGNMATASVDSLLKKIVSLVSRPSPEFNRYEALELTRLELTGGRLRLPCLQTEIRFVGRFLRASVILLYFVKSFTVQNKR